MKKHENFIQKYWITFMLFACMIFSYKITADYELADAFLFPPLESIIKAFLKNKDVMFINMLYSFQLMIPAIAIALVIALSVGTLMGMNKRLREILHPIIYTVRYRLESQI